MWRIQTTATCTSTFCTTGTPTLIFCIRLFSTGIGYLSRIECAKNWVFVFTCRSLRLIRTYQHSLRNTSLMYVLYEIWEWHPSGLCSISSAGFWYEALYLPLCCSCPVDIEHCKLTSTYKNHRKASSSDQMKSANSPPWLTVETRKSSKRERGRERGKKEAEIG